MECLDDNVASEFVSGSLAVFTRFDAYVPRQEAPSFTAGGRQAMFDRIEWKIIPDASTAANALVAGEVDWLETPIPDLVPMLRKSRDVVVGRLDPIGLYPVLRPNSLLGPTANKGVRQAILAAIDQREMMEAVMGDDPATYHLPTGCFLPGTESWTDAGLDRLGPKSPEVVRRMLKDAGYDNESLLLMHPTDQPLYDAMSQVAASALKKSDPPVLTGT